MNDINLKAILTPLCGIAATWLASKLNFLGIDQATWMTLVTTTVFAGVAAILGIFTKTSNVLDTAGSQPGTVVVTTQANAAALPANPDVIAVTPQIKAAVEAAK